MRIIKLSDFDRAFLTGCDKATEWQLPWFTTGFKKHNPDAKLSLADFGMTDNMLEWATASKMFHSIGQMDTKSVKGWFLKPGCMLGTPYKEVCWLDTDVEVRGDMTEIFRYIKSNKLLMAVDNPWTKRMGQKTHNSGVVAFMNKPQVLRAWAEACVTSQERGDQEQLHAMLDPLQKNVHIEDMPNKFNYLRIDFLDKRSVADIRAVHWTGQKGKDKIRELMQ